MQIQRDDVEQKACVQHHHAGSGSDSNKNILICVPTMNGGLTGLERHQGE